MVVNGEIKPIVEITQQKQVKLLGMFKMNTPETSIINMEDGETLKVQHKWYYFLCSGKVN